MFLFDMLSFPSASSSFSVDSPPSYPPTSFSISSSLWNASMSFLAASEALPVEARRVRKSPYR